MTCFLFWDFAVDIPAPASCHWRARAKVEKGSRHYTGLYLWYLLGSIEYIPLHDIQSIIPCKTNISHRQRGIPKNVLPSSRNIKQIQPRKIPHRNKLLRHKPLKIRLCIEQFPKRRRRSRAIGTRLLRFSQSTLLLLNTDFEDLEISISCPRLVTIESGFAEFVDELIPTLQKLLVLLVPFGEEPGEFEKEEE